MQEWASFMWQYCDADTPDRDMHLKLIDRIEVGEGYTVNRQKERRIRIYYKLVDNIG